MELMDWKQIETSAEEAINTSKVSIEINTIMLHRAKCEIIKLGGQTNVQIEAEAKHDREKQKNRTTK